MNSTADFSLKPTIPRMSRDERKALLDAGGGTGRCEFCNAIRDFHVDGKGVQCVYCSKYVEVEGDTVTITCDCGKEHVATVVGKTAQLLSWYCPVQQEQKTDVNA